MKIHPEIRELYYKYYNSPICLSDKKFLEDITKIINILEHQLECFVHGRNHKIE